MGKDSDLGAEFSSNSCFLIKLSLVENWCTNMAGNVLLMMTGLCKNMEANQQGFYEVRIELLP